MEDGIKYGLFSNFLTLRSAIRFINSSNLRGAAYTKEMNGVDFLALEYIRNCDKSLLLKIKTIILPYLGCDKPLENFYEIAESGANVGCKDLFVFLFCNLSPKKTSSERKFTMKESILNRFANNKSILDFYFRGELGDDILSESVIDKCLQAKDAETLSKCLITASIEQINYFVTIVCDKIKPINSPLKPIVTFFCCDIFNFNRFSRDDIGDFQLPIIRKILSLNTTESISTLKYAISKIAKFEDQLLVSLEVESILYRLKPGKNVQTKNIFSIFEKPAQFILKSIKNHDFSNVTFDTLLITFQSMERALKDVINSLNELEKLQIALNSIMGCQEKNCNQKYMFVRRVYKNVPLFL